jgi:(S)-mandelate dehydrogenase
MQRQFYSGTHVQRALSIEELRAMAQRWAPHFAFEYLDGGAEDEITRRWNRAIFETIRFIPRTLVDTTARQQQIRLFGRESPSPLIVAPTGLNGLQRFRGDIALARAAAVAGIPFTLSAFSNVRLEEVAAEAGGRLWMQLYILRDRRIAQDIVNRADQAGYEALVLTSDANVAGLREWDRRNYRPSGQLTLRNLLNIAAHPRWVMNVLIPHGIPRFANLEGFFPPEIRSPGALIRYLQQQLAPNITWEDLRCLRDIWPRRLILKGVLSVADARRAADLGCDGMVLTNHGGRQFDHCISPLEVLPAIADAVGERLVIIVDSGFQRGADVVKALALGANAVMVGAAVVYGLSAGGEPGARHALHLLTSEVDRVLGQLGCVALEDLGPHLLRTSEN